MTTDQTTAYQAGRDSYNAGDEAAPGCPISPVGRAYMRGYIDAAQGR